jgi:hypothetical protein
MADNSLGQAQPHLDTEARVYQGGQVSPGHPGSTGEILVWSPDSVRRLCRYSYQLDGVCALYGEYWHDFMWLLLWLTMHYTGSVSAVSQSRRSIHDIA